MATPILFWNGTAWASALVDGSGHLQIDALTSGLPTGAATATNQLTEITALQLIDDLRAALQSVAGDEIRVNIAKVGGGTVTPDGTFILPVSLYAYGSAAADTALLAESATYKTLRTSVWSGGAQATMGRANADGTDQDAWGLHVYSNTLVSNGVSVDRLRNNEEATALASAARTASVASADLTLHNARGLVLMVNVSAIADTPSITPYLQSKDPVSGLYFTVWTAASPLTAVATSAYLFVVGLLAAAAGSYTQAVNIQVGRTIRVGFAHGDADLITYSASIVKLV